MCIGFWAIIDARGKGLVHGFLFSTLSSDPNPRAPEPKQPQTPKVLTSKKLGVLGFGVLRRYHKQPETLKHLEAVSLDS